MNVIQTIIILIIIVGSVILHELAHGLVAYWLRDDTAKEAGRLDLNPLKHIDPILSILVPMILFLIGAPVFGAAKPVPIDYSKLKWREWGMALVSLAGPFTNFLIALIAFLIGHFTGWLYGGGVLEFIFLELIFTNLGFMLFNLIPVPPLDGSRVLYAISPDRVREFLSMIEPYGFILVYILILLFGDVFSKLMINGTNGIIDFFYLIVGR